jgi:peptidoglycan/xylan/chitin deacetylase (PgdA/CDA1 family)
MKSSRISERIVGRYQRTVSRLFFRRVLKMHNPFPLISFSFDDFPRSALLTGGALLRRFGVRGTYYASLGLIGQDTPSGTIFATEDLEAVMTQGHELGCHTHAHCDSWVTSPGVFEASIIENSRALDAVVPGARFRTFSYPICPPRPENKRRAAKHFVCCRSAGQAFNAGTIDLSCLYAHFLERSRENSSWVRDLIDRNCRERGWLIFATHDICENPSPYGCSPAFLEEVVRWAAHSGATVLPVGEALEAIRVYASA